MGNNAATRQNIIDAFWALYRQKSLDKISIKEVAAKAGYNRSTFYEYFSGTGEILELIKDSLIVSIHDLPPFRLSGRELGRETEEFFAQFEDKLEYYALLLGDRGDLRFQRRLKQKIKDILVSELIGSAGADSWKTDITLEYLISGLLGVMSWYFSTERKVSRDELQVFMQDLLVKGLPECLSGPSAS